MMGRQITGMMHVIRLSVRAAAFPGLLMHANDNLLDRKQNFEPMPDVETSIEIHINGEPHRGMAMTLAALIDEIGYKGERVATAVNGDFVPSSQRGNHRLQDGDRVEIVAPRQGG